MELHGKRDDAIEFLEGNVVFVVQGNGIDEVVTVSFGNVEGQLVKEAYEIRLSQCLSVLIKSPVKSTGSNDGVVQLKLGEEGELSVCGRSRRRK